MGWNGLDWMAKRLGSMIRGNKDQKKREEKRNSCRRVIFVRSYAKTRSQIDVNKKEVGQRESII